MVLGKPTPSPSEDAPCSLYKLRSWQSDFGLLRERSYPLGVTAAASYADRILRGAGGPIASTRLGALERCL
jgi:hypothetical protein